MAMAMALREEANSSELTLMAMFARMNTMAMAVAVAGVFAAGLALATAVLLVQGAPPGVPIGPNLSALGNIFPGYSVTWPGVLIGAFWAGLVGALTGFFVATAWNFAHLVFLGFLALDHPQNPPLLRRPRDQSRRVVSAPEEQRLISAAARLNVAITAIGAGLSLGMLLFLATHISLGVANRPGYYLNLLGVFMPGYSASSAGAWFGLLWGLVYGAVSGGVVAWLYVQSLGANLSRLLIWDKAAALGIRPPVLRISNHALGIALGGVAAIQLVLSTLWLVLRGTADESVHAKLLSHYLPGYSVGLLGGLVGGLELFVILYVFASMVGAIYNATAWRLERGGT
jgi:hypothetical protein